MAVKRLWIDLETYSEVPIKHGTHAYARGAEVMLWAYALEKEPVKCWDLTTGAPMPRDLAAHLDDSSVEIVAHNYQFEVTVLRARGYPVDEWHWHCTMAQALQHGLPGALEKLSAVFKLPTDQAKDADGKRLVQLFCVPRPKNMKLRRATRLTHPAEWQRFIEYCVLDVEAMRAVAAKLPKWNLLPFERVLFELDGRINARGVQIDTSLAKHAVRAIDAEQKRLREQTEEITESALTSTTKVAAFRAYLAEQYDLEFPDMRAATVERALSGADLPEEVRELLLIRTQTSLTSAAKYKTVLKGVSPDGRMRGTLQFCGAARTGRWAGRGLQPQNLARPTLKQRDIELAIRAFKEEAEDLVLPNIMEAASNAVRGLIVPSKGKKLVVADESNIEGRVLAWLAGEQWKLDAFRAYDTIIGYDENGKPLRAGPDLYKLAYSRSFNKPIEEVDGDDRFIGKVQELALGYQGAVGAFGSMAALYGVELPEDEILKIVRAWRQANSKIRAFWYACENAAKAATVNRNMEFEVGKVVFDRDKNWLRCRLPSGRYLCYASPIVDEETEKLSHMGVDPYTKQFKRLKTYGGKIVENITQAVARDVLGGAMPRAEQAGYEIVLSVHDELITEAPDTDGYNAPALCAILAQGEEWTEGLPLAAAGFEAYRYRKD